MFREAAGATQWEGSEAALTDAGAEGAWGQHTAGPMSGHTWRGRHRRQPGSPAGPDSGTAQLRGGGRGRSWPRAAAPGPGRPQSPASRGQTLRCGPAPGMGQGVRVMLRLFGWSTGAVGARGGGSLASRVVWGSFGHWVVPSSSSPTLYVYICVGGWTGGSGVGQVEEGRWEAWRSASWRRNVSRQSVSSVCSAVRAWASHATSSSRLWLSILRGEGPIGGGRGGSAPAPQVAPVSTILRLEAMTVPRLSLHQRVGIRA